ncbi:MAG TPA: dTDP-4-dehydrorhamnose reductase [Streptosporangiaceae bacterium]|nr:dTDP-4-dehydrorhamnose reductase [Streptosporangiaceae bacterium]
MSASAGSARWLVTGAGGMLGRDLVSLLERQGAPVTPVTRSDLDITDRQAVLGALREAQPDIVVNCAAWTAVDLAESREADALAVNGEGAANVAAGCALAGARMIQLSTDYVFDGTARVPYPEDAAPAPATAYGRTKLAGEQAVTRLLPGRSWILRTAWLYGAHGGSFVATMIGLAGRAGDVTVVDDQHGQPTSTVTVAELILALVRAEAPDGIYHATCSGQTTWFGLAREIFGLLGADPERVTPIPSTQLTRPAPRPAYSVLGHGAWARAGLEPPEDWRAALHRDFAAFAPAS